MITSEAETFSVTDCLTVVGWYKEALKMSGAKHVRIQEEECRAKGGLCDPGANICMTNKLSLLLNAKRLDHPLPVGVALNVEGSLVSNSVCTHVGDLPLPLTSGDYYFQKCYYNPSATDTFLSPHAVCRDSDGLLDDWTMKRWTGTGEGNLSITSPAGPI